MLALTLVQALGRDAKERQRAGGRAKGSAKLRQAGKASVQAAKVVGVSARSVEHAKTLRERAPKLAAEVAKGTRSLNKAMQGLADHDRLARQAAANQAFDKRVQKRMKQARVPYEEAWRAEAVADGLTVEGRRKIFESRTIRQITLAYGLEDARAVATWLKEVMSVTNTQNPSHAMLKIKDWWPQLKRCLPKTP